MNKLLAAAGSALLYVWQLPQNLMGLIYLAICTDRLRVVRQHGAVFYATRRVKGGVTLGRYVFVAAKRMTREPIYDHEYGHVRQSKWLGPLWLLIIALPSVMHNLLQRSGNYYSFYTESWANKWGGIPGYKGEYEFREKGFVATDPGELAALYQTHFLHG